MEQWDSMLNQIAEHQNKSLAHIADQNDALCAIAAAINELQTSLRVISSIQPLKLVPLHSRDERGEGHGDSSFKSLVSATGDIFTNAGLHSALESLNSSDRFDTMEAEVFYAVLPLLILWLGDAQRCNHSITLVNEGFLRFGNTKQCFGERQYRKLWRSVLIKLENALDGGAISDQLLVANAHQLILHLRQGLFS